LETFSTDIQSLITKKVKLIKGADQSLYKDFTNIEKAIVNGILKQVKRMDIKDGIIQFDEKNVALVNELNKVIAGAIQGSSYPVNVKSYIGSFDTIRTLNEDIHRDLNDLDPSEIEDKLNQVQKTNVQNVLDNLVRNGMEQGFVEPVKQGIFKNIVGGMNLEDFQSYLETTILSDPLKQGQFKRYVTQISRDALNQYDGQINQQIATDLGLDAYRYVGSLIEDSRPQCRRWVAKEILLKEELTDEISWATNNGSGMIPGTNSENFATYRGGYSCRHQAIPFKMTKREREEYDKLLQTRPKQEEAKVDQQTKEVAKDIQKATNEKAKAVGNQELNPNIFLSTQSKEVNDSYNLVVQNADGMTEVANRKNTLVTLRSPEENTSNLATQKFVDSTNPQQKGRYLPTIDVDSNGHCAQSGSYMQIKWGNDYVCEFTPIPMTTDLAALKKLEQEGKIKLTTDKNGPDGTERPVAVRDTAGSYLGSLSNKTGDFKWWSMSSAGKANRGVRNIAPTITHESGHLIHFDKDPGILYKGGSMSSFMKKNKLTLKDSPTEYGEANSKEFFTEAFTYYTYDRAGLKLRHPKVFKFIEEYCTDIGIDLKTIIEPE
jgi:hypothetical protein